MKKKVFSFLGLFFVLIITMFILTGCGVSSKSSNLSEKELKELIPDDVKSYHYDADTYTSSIESINIVRQNTENGENTAYCEVELKDDRLTRIAYLCLESKYYDQGGWYLESYSAYEDEVVKDWSKDDIKKAAINELDSYEFEGYNFISSEIDDYSSDKYYNYDDKDQMNITHLYEQLKVAKSTFKLNKEYSYLSLDGDLFVYDILKRSSGTEYPMYYATYLCPETVYIDEVWKFDGEYKANFQGEFGTYAITLNLKNVDDWVFSWKGTCDYTNSDGTTNYQGSDTLDITSTILRKEGENDQGTVTVVKTVKLSEAELEVPLSIGFKDFYLLFTPNGFYIYEQSSKKYRVNLFSDNEKLYTPIKLIRTGGDPVVK